MTWFKVDDGLAEHRKVRLLGRDKAPAMGVWVLCGAWAASNLTDGFVPREVVRRYDSRLKYSSRLVEVGLWSDDEEDGEAGYRFHDWADIQPTRADVESRREEGRRRVQKHRKGRSDDLPPPDRDPHGGGPPSSDPDLGNALHQGGSNGVSNALLTDSVTEPYSRARTAAGGRPVPSRPVQTRTEEQTSSSETAARPRRDQASRPDVDRLCDQLHAELSASEIRHTVGDKWRTAARLLLDQDHRLIDEAVELIKWSTHHHFWASNIQSMPTFRRQYDKLRIQKQNEDGRGHLKVVSNGYRPYADPPDPSIYHQGFQ